MVCIYCREKTQVINSRPQKSLGATWRRRRCTRCHAVFTTIETADLASSLLVRLSDGHMEPFNRDKVLLSIVKSLGHRSDVVAAAGALTDTIIAKTVKSAKSAVISHDDIIIISTDTLGRFDPVAGIHYAAYHKPNGPVA